MSIEVRVPQLPESVADATVLTWHKKPGEAVKRGENLVDIETDKVVLDVPAPEDGVLAEIVRKEGSTVVAEELIASIKPGAAPKSSGESSKSEESSKSAKSSKSEDPSEAEEPSKAAASAKGKAGPAARRMMAEAGVNPDQVAGSGRGGVVTKDDVAKHVGSAKAASKAAPARATESSKVVDFPTLPASERPEERVPMSRLRKRIAERLVQAQQTAAILTTFNEVNMKPVMDLRARYKDQFEKVHGGTRLGFMSFFVKASIEALKKYPAVNAYIDGDDIVYHGYYDIGIAVSAPRGLVVPIVRDADQLSFAEVEAKIAEFGNKAKEGSLSIEDLSGGTFSISNGGVFGSMMSTPILNPPQSAILGMHKTFDRPVVENGQVVVRPMMYLALSYDHRIVDGREAVQFLVTIKDCLEDPARLLLQV